MTCFFCFLFFISFQKKKKIKKNYNQFSCPAASHSQGAAQTQVHRQTLQEDVLSQRAD